MKKQIHIGFRIIKTAVAVMICFVIFFLRGQKGIPFYSAIAAILCMQQYGDNSFMAGRNRMVGTIVGAIYGTILLTGYYFHLIEFHVMYLLIALCIILVIETSVWIGQPQVAYFSCVVFLSIATNHINDEVPYFFIMNRVLDTFIGIVVSLGVNAVRIPRSKQKNILFVTGLDDVILKKDGTLSPHTQVDLNRLIKEGADITVATERTPASMLDSVRDLHIKLPVITMNGAALYDIENNKYIKRYLIDKDTTGAIAQLLQKMNAGCFINVFVQDVLLIRCEDIKNSAMQTVYRTLHKSPYRNYLYGPIQEGESAAYFYVIDTPEKIADVKEALEQAEFRDKIRMVSGIEKREAGFHYIKIYSSRATKENMIGYLRDMIRAEQVITFGSIEGVYDMVNPEGDDHFVVKQIKNRYEPVFWKKQERKS